MIVREILAVLTAYLLGSIPFAYIVARAARGVDIRQVGNRNVGSMNAWREAGTLPGIVVLVLDIAKGSLAVLAAKALGVPLIFVMTSGIAVVAGHNWPVFLHFRGGRGAATALGTAAAVLPEQFAMGLPVIAVLFLLTRNTGLALGSGLLVILLVSWVTGQDAITIFYPVVLAVPIALKSLLDVKRGLAKKHTFKTAVFGRMPFPWNKGKTKSNP